ncbi:MAG: hypothetical protein Ta2D_03200 [Rickettsiales bacterium]|nr:MAG: hypothetical protein Ta2D_03200 [Rickettsiales bacterium]
MDFVKEFTSITQLNDALKKTFQKEFFYFKVTGEIASFTEHKASGHYYFQLKDAATQIGATMWRTNTSKVKFAVQNGLKVVAFGKLDLWNEKHYVNVEKMDLDGEGDIFKKFQELKEKLSSEGLLKRKNPLDKMDEKLVVFGNKIKSIRELPQNIGIISKIGSAGFQDIMKNLFNKTPIQKIKVIDVAVQGQQCANDIIKAIEYFNNRELKIPDISDKNFIHTIEQKYITELDYNLKLLKEQKPLCNLTGDEFQKRDDKNFKQQAIEFFNSLNNKTDSMIGEIQLTSKGIRKMIKNKLYKEKTCALKSIPDVLKNGILINKELKWKNRDYDTYLIIGTINIANIEYIVEIIIHNFENEKIFYLEEIENKELFFKKIKYIKDSPEVIKTTFKGRPQGNTHNSILASFIQNVNSFKMDVIIISRGGGDRWNDLGAFDNENLARAVFNSKIPVITAVGHDVDWTLIDYVSDLRLPTPTSVATTLTITKQEAQAKIQALFRQYVFNLANKFKTKENRIGKTKHLINQTIIKIAKNLLIKQNAITELFKNYCRKKIIQNSKNNVLISKINIEIILKTKFLKLATYFKNVELKILQYQKKFPIIKDLNRNEVKFKKDFKIGEKYSILLPDGIVQVQVIN